MNDYLYGPTVEDGLKALIFSTKHMLEIMELVDIGMFDGDHNMAKLRLQLEESKPLLEYRLSKLQE
jgi:hypothetical protein